MSFDEAMRVAGLQPSQVVRIPIGTQKGKFAVYDGKSKKHSGLSFCNEQLYEISFDFTGDFRRFAEMVEEEASVRGSPETDIAFRYSKALAWAKWAVGSNYVRIIFELSENGDAGISKTFADSLVEDLCLSQR